MIVLIINGAPRSGKDTFIDFIKEHKFKICKYSSIDWVKQQAKLLGWDGEKDIKGRKFLSDLKNAVTEYANIPFKKIISNILSTDCDFFCTCIREPNEIEKLKTFCGQMNIQCHSVLIKNEIAEKEANKQRNRADIGYMHYEYDTIIFNESDLKVLKANTYYFITKDLGLI